MFYPVVSTKINKAVNEYQLQKKLASSGLNNTQIQQILNPVNLQVVNLNENNPANIALDSSYFVEIMYGFIVPFILLLPFFLASNIVTDSIVGERERKTFEVLLMTPISSSYGNAWKNIANIIFFSYSKCCMDYSSWIYSKFQFIIRFSCLYYYFSWDWGSLVLEFYYLCLLIVLKEANSAITIVSGVCNIHIIHASFYKDILLHSYLELHTNSYNGEIGINT